ncbi:TPA: hypothetical protein MDC26_001493 [Klebsiella aerogenes]|nr:hypothetical protein [Klebsiella aerogenes]
MSALEKWDEETFIQLMRDSLPIQPESDDEPVHLATERHNPTISWEEFAGDFS